MVCEGAHSIADNWKVIQGQGHMNLVKGKVILAIVMVQISKLAYLWTYERYLNDFGV